MAASTGLYPPRENDLVERGVGFFARRWLLWVNLFFGLYAGLPWLSPLARAGGLKGLGEGIFFAYRFLCHQQAAYSYHLLGYQVAYCQRDTAIYTTIFLAGLLFGLLRRRLPRLPGWVLLLGSAPMGLDGLTQTPRALLPSWPLREQNPWAVFLTGGALPTWFYVGDAVGSLNWWLRTLTGILFGLTLVLVAYPWIEREMRRGGLTRVTVVPPAAPRFPHGRSEETGPAAALCAGRTPPPGELAGPAPASRDDRKRRRPDVGAAARSP